MSKKDIHKILDVTIGENLDTSDTKEESKEMLTDVKEDKFTTECGYPSDKHGENTKCPFLT